MSRSPIEFTDRPLLALSEPPQGYDVHALSLLGLQTTGIEVSPKAVEEANKWIQVQPEQPKEGAGSGVVELGDFFKWKEGEGDEGKYDVFYDYTVSSCVALLP